MAIFEPIRALSPVQRNTFLASFLGWTLDAFDFFLVTFVVVQIAKEFGKSIPTVAFAITLTLMMRPLGALIFGLLADRYGRRGPLMIDIGLYSVLELATAFSPNFTVFLILRAVYGVAMGGEWGIGAALAMEALPARSRGVFSGILQEGYALGFLIAAVAYFLVFPHWGWRGMFVLGTLPALLILFIRSRVPESEAWKASNVNRLGQVGSLWKSFRDHWVLFIYAIVLMTAFNFMSHGTQDLYPTFLERQRGLGVGTVSLVTIIANVGAILGGTLFGALSQRFGRRRAIVAAVLLGILMIPLWVFAKSLVLLALGGFLMQFMVQGAWGIIPAHLNELSPGDVRGTFPGFTYQIGNLFSAGAAQMEAAFAQNFHAANGGADYARALAILAVTVFVAVAILTAIGRERRSVEFVPQARAA